MTSSTLTIDTIAALAVPFPIEMVEIKPGAVSREGTSALALAYADWRLYAERLDQAVGPSNWSIELIPWGETRLIARLTICGVSKSASGEGAANDENCGTIAEAQAKKRACAEFGLGRYFYFLPRLWGKGQGDRKSFRFDDGEARRLVQTMYQQAHLTVPTAPRATTTNRTNVPAASPEPPRHEAPPARLATARAALQDAEERTRTATPQPGSPHAASPKQRNYIATLLNGLRGQVQPAILNRIGNEVANISGLSGVQDADSLPASLSSAQASAIIERLREYQRQAA